MELSQDQNLALRTLIDWHKSKTKKFVTLGGYAGTGKTTLISIFRHELEKTKKTLKVAFCSFTGKASQVLLNKLCHQHAIYPKDSVSTIHSLLYTAILNSKKEVVGWEKKTELNYDLIIVDEASMIDQELWTDLTSYGVPIIAVGDHGQLPPIHGNFNLMKSPNIVLREVHRQAKNNPIIAVSIQARETGFIDYQKFGPGVMKLKKDSPDAQEEISNAVCQSSTMVLCGYNNTRVKLNKFIRSQLGFEGEKPEFRDRVICLKNNRKKNIFNGMIGKINYIESLDENFFVKIQMDDLNDPFEGVISSKQFNSLVTLDIEYSKKDEIDLFDFGYAMTVHKAQGSQARRVVLFEERFRQMDDISWRRWLYTAVTRAEEELIIVG